MIDNIKYLFIKKIYADHNDSSFVKSAIDKLLSDLPADAKGLNIGAGKTNLDPRIENMELESGDGIDIVGSVESIPCDNESFDLVITQEVLEHVQYPHIALREIYRILKRNGMAYIQLPFIIGYHPCPKDYWRFSDEGLKAVVENANMEVMTMSMSVGPAVGFYRIAVEFFAILLSSPFSKIYKPAKMFFALLLYPLKWLDPILRKNNEANRIAGGYFVVCRKK